MKTILAAALCGSALCGTYASPPSPPEPLFQPSLIGTHPCAKSVESCEGELHVPLDWRTPDGSKITIAFAWHPRRDRSRPATGTVFANFGGPGPSIAPLSNYRSTLGDVLDRQNLLLVDPRGHGKSTPLTCPGLELAKPETVVACADELGPRIRSFGTDQVAHDIEAVRSALGVPKMSVFGNSYGTVIGPAYAARYPERVRALYLDSVVASDAQDGYATNPMMSAEVFTAGRDDLRLLCRRSVFCRGISGDPVERLAQLISVLRRTPDRRVPTERLAMLHIQLFEPAYGREVAAASTAYLQGDRAPLYRLLDMLDATWGGPERTDPSEAGVLATLCADAEYPFDRRVDPAEKVRQLDAYHTRQRPFDPFRLNEVDVLLDYDRARACAHWPTRQHSPPIPPNADLPDVPVLVVSGDLDTTTPESGGRELAKRFPDAKYVEIPNGAHSNALSPLAPHKQCINRVMREFLKDPAHPVHDPGCDARTVPALGRFPTTSDQLPQLLDVVLDWRSHRSIGATFATASDAAVRMNPSGVYAPFLKRQPGLRGGMVTYDHENRVVHLDAVRFVKDVAVSGTVRLDSSHRATASLTTSGSDGVTHQTTMGWQTLEAGPLVRVRGSMDGTPFDVIAPTGW